MKTYSALKAQIEKLEKQAQSMRQTEVKKVVADLKKTIADYGLTAADLGLTGGSARRPGRPGRAGAVRAGVPKYRNPQTGDTWTGRGRPPAWIVGAKSRDAFLIDGNGSAGHRNAAATQKSGRKGG